MNIMKKALQENVCYKQYPQVKRFDELTNWISSFGFSTPVNRGINEDIWDFAERVSDFCLQVKEIKQVAILADRIQTEPWYIKNKNFYNMACKKLGKEPEEHFAIPEWTHAYARPGETVEERYWALMDWKKENFNCKSSWYDTFVSVASGKAANAEREVRRASIERLIKEHQEEETIVVGSSLYPNTDDFRDMIKKVKEGKARFYVYHRFAAVVSTRCTTEDVDRVASMMETKDVDVMVQRFADAF